jgi:hypothetical protein
MSQTQKQHPLTVHTCVGDPSLSSQLGTVVDTRPLPEDAVLGSTIALQPLLRTAATCRTYGIAYLVQLFSS